MKLFLESCSFICENRVIFALHHLVDSAFVDILVYSADKEVTFNERNRLDIHSRKEIRSEISELAKLHRLQPGKVAKETYEITFTDPENEKKYISFSFRGTQSEDYCFMTRNDSNEECKVKGNISNYAGLTKYAKSKLE